MNYPILDLDYMLPNKNYGGLNMPQPLRTLALGTTSAHFSVDSTWSWDFQEIIRMRWGHRGGTHNNISGFTRGGRGTWAGPLARLCAGVSPAIRWLGKKAPTRYPADTGARLPDLPATRIPCLIHLCSPSLRPGPGILLQWQKIY